MRILMICLSCQAWNLKMVKTWNEKVRICLLCFLWYSISSLNNIIGKKLLTRFPHPISLSLIHLLSAAVYLGPVLDFWKIPKGPRIPYRTYLQFIVPLGLGRVFGSVSAHVTIWKVPVSYAHTGIKCWETLWVGCSFNPSCFKSEFWLSRILYSLASVCYSD